MLINRLILVAVAAAGFCANASAASGTFHITAAPSSLSPAIVGYCDGTGCGPAHGTTDNIFLSDGKVLQAIRNIDLFTAALNLRISGFTSDPGQNYFDHLAVNCQRLSPFGFNPASTAAYSFNPATGTGTWSWAYPISDFRPPSCFASGGSYTVQIVD
jgi:hypothetical protein